MNTGPGQSGATNLLGGLSAQQLAALSSVIAAGQHGFSQAQLATLAAVGGIGLTNALSGVINNLSQHPAIPVQGGVGVDSKNVAGVVPDLATTSLPWPVVSPVMNVPHFNLPSYRLVNLDVSPSRDANGFDLPLSDVTTLRFFFNLGVQQSRSLAASQLYQERIAHGGTATASPSVGQSPSTSVNQFVGLGGILPPAVSGCNSRNMEQYLGQLGLMGPQAQCLIRQAQSQQLAQQAQLLSSATARLQEQPQSTFLGAALPFQPDILSVASQTSISSSVCAPTSQLLRPLLVPNGTSNCVSSPLHSQKPLAAASTAGGQQAYYLDQAVSAVANAQSDKHDMRLQLLQQQGAGIGLHSLLSSSSEGVLKPVAVSGVSADAALSPRPPPVDPSPPRLLSDSTTNVAEASTSCMLVHQQAQTSPPSSRDLYPLTVDKRSTPCIGVARTPDAREQDLPGAQSLSKNTPQNSAPATPAMTSDDVVAVSQTLFQVSEQHFTEAFNASRKKSTPNTIGIARTDCTSTTDEVTAEISSSTIPVQQRLERRDLDDKPALAPILMMTYLSNCMNNIKSTLSTNGLPIGLDANGRAVDYSSRPIDPIFQQARARMENAREFREVSPPRMVCSQSQAISRVPVADDELVTASSCSAIGVALPTISSAIDPPQSSQSIGINRTPTGADGSENSSNTGDEDSPFPAEKRKRVTSDGE
ncbi:hypothetical protein Q1695_001672 [Nippostrongylus brasiliensis]|nr:hypothetical protein Q1695_001672 [Nippostrongylus brasiliensis]